MYQLARKADMAGARGRCQILENAVMQETETRESYRPTIRNDELPAFITHQCAWCGMIQDGPLTGLYPTTSTGLVAIIAGEYISHGICVPCRETWIARKS